MRRTHPAERVAHAVIRWRQDRLVAHPRAVWLAAVAADAAVPFHAFLWVWPLMIIVHMLPLSFGGLGIREITLVYVLERLYGTTAESVLLISMIALLATALLGLAGGVWNSVSAANSGKSAE